MIYCRVSSRKQVTEGDGLGSQERRCRDYAQSRGYAVLAVFADGVTGSLGDRPGLLQMLAFLAQEPPGLVVLVDDIKRFARDVGLHFALKGAIEKCGARLEGPLLRIEDSPEGKFIETILAAQAELERNQNQRQVVGRMKARLEQGFYVFAAPPGYRYAKHLLHNKVLVVDDAKASLIREALNGYASGRFQSHMDIERFLTGAGFYGTLTPPKSRVTFRLNQIARMLRQIVYTGFVEHAPWSVTLRQGQHPSLITMETFERIQERRGEKRRPVPPKIVEATLPAVAFSLPLRGLIDCDTCGRPLTGSISRGKTGRRYGYYHCTYRGCALYGSTIPAGVLEGEFMELLKRLTASDTMIQMVREAVGKEWDQGRKNEASKRERAAREAKEVEKRIEELADTIADTKSAAVRVLLEEKVETLVRRKAVLEGEPVEPAFAQDPIPDAGTLFRKVEGVLQNPSETWKTGDTTTRQVVTRLVFPRRLRYVRNQGFGTPDYALPYRVLTTLAESNSCLVDLTPEVWRDFIVEISLWDLYLSPPEKGFPSDAFPFQRL